MIKISHDLRIAEESADMSSASHIDPEDIARFENLADQWWDTDGPMEPLHAFTPVRIQYILDCLKKAGRLSQNTTRQPLHGLRILDIGCGGGLLAEPLSRLGADMMGIDASEGAIKAARIHASQQNLDISYHTADSTDLAHNPEFKGAFDLVYASEVIEHVTDRKVFLKAMAQLVKRDGLVILTTINQTLAALLGAKIAAEYLLKIVPAGTHDFHKFVRPKQLANECKEQGILVHNITGFVPQIGGGFTSSSITAINYGVCGRRQQ